MNCPYLQEPEGASLEPCCSDSGRSDMSKSTTIASASLPPELETASCTTPPFSGMSKHSSVTGMPKAIREWLMSLRPVSLASPSPLPERCEEQTIAGTCGRPRQSVLELCAPDTLCLKMCQESAATCPWLSETCADLGMRFQDPLSLGLTTLAHRIEENESGYFPTMRSNLTGNITPDRRNDKFNNLESVLARQMWPTPKGSPSGPDFARMNRKESGGDDLATSVARFPTPLAGDFRTGYRLDTEAGIGRRKMRCNALRDHVSPGGQLNPTWVEWLMGWLLGWTDLKVSVTAKSLSVWLRHGKSFLGESVE